METPAILILTLHCNFEKKYHSGPETVSAEEAIMEAMEGVYSLLC